VAQPFRLCAFCVLLTFPLSAQTDRAQLSGIVRDASGAVLVDAILTAQHEDTGARRTVRSDSNGAYVIAGLPAGPYKVTVRKPGFQTVARLHFPLADANALALDFTLQIGSVREVITIEGDAPLMNTADASVGATIAGNAAQALPLNGRGLLSLVDLVPGVVATPATTGEAGQFTVAGQRANTNQFTIDGVNANTGVGSSAVPAQFFGGTLPTMSAFGSTHNLASFDDLQEVRVQTSSIAPEFGRLPGAHVAVTTRSGSNDLHGSLFYNFRDRRLSAASWFANRQGLDAGALRFHNAGASAGGPIRKNRTFFHASWELLRFVQPFAWNTVVPSTSARRAAPAQYRPLLDAFPLPNGPALPGGLAGFTAGVSRPARLDSGAIRIDHALTSRITLFGRYNNAPSSAEAGYAYVERSQFRYNSLTLGATTVHSPALSTEVRLNVTHVAATAGWLASGLGGAQPVDLRRYLPPVDPTRAAVYGFALGGVGDILTGEGGRNRQGQMNLAGTLALNRDTHEIRFGVDYQRLTPSRESAAVTTVASSWSLADLLGNTFLMATSAYADRAAALIEVLSFFAQDTWRPMPRLSLTYGARWEITPAPSLQQQAPTGLASVPVLGTTPTAVDLSFRLWPTRYNQVAPRVGAAWRITDRTVARVGWGLFYDLSFSAATDPINGYPFNHWQIQGLGPTASVAVLSRQLFAPALKLPYAHHLNAAVEHAVSSADVISLSYVGSAGRLLLRREGTPQPGTRIANLIVATNHGSSDYHALQASYRRRLARGLDGMASYTWSHSLDNGSWDSAVALVAPGIDDARDRGSSSFDARHVFSAAFSYATPKGFRLSTAFRARTGFPIDVLSAENLLGLGFDNITRPDLLTGAPLWLADPGAPNGRRLNRAAFTAPAGVQGNLGRNAIAGFGTWQIDASLSRRFVLTERLGLELRADAYNATNHPAFGDPVRYLDSPLFGESASHLNMMLGRGSPRSGLAPLLQVGGPRTMQVGLRLTF
jgi:Carboxypeptidase regulatory-like domain/TonB dependent receptor